VRTAPGLALLALVCSLELVDLSLITAITPLLPEYAERLDLTTAETGRIVAAFGFGNVLAALPAAVLCCRIGAKPVALAGLLVMAGGSVGLALADSLLELEAARFVQGAASSTAWGAGIAWLATATPPGRRGRVLGISGAFAVAGTLAGPGVGALAASFGITTVFAAFAGLVLAVAAWGAATPGVPASRQPLRALAAALRSPRLAFGGWLIFVAGAFLAAQSSIAPLRLDVLGWSAAGIAAIYTAAAALEGGGNLLLGRWIDAGGRRALVLAALAVATALAAVLALPPVERYWPYAIAVGASAAVFGLLFLPALTSLADGADAAGLDHAYGFSLASLAWAPAQVVGALAGGTLAERAGDSVPFGVLAGVTLATLLAFARVGRRPARGRRPGEGIGGDRAPADQASSPARRRA
jgi:predicted MFS family arabinose efflux permease